MWLIFSIILILLIFISLKLKWYKKTVDWKYPRILMYHMVREHIDGAKFNKLRVKPEQFEQQIRYLKQQGFHFVTMSELYHKHGQLPEKTVAITFDDGYLDNLTQAFPILQKYQAKATIYVVVDRHNRDWSTYKKEHHNNGELMREPKLSDDDILTLVQSGLIEIGSHTITHANLNKLSDDECYAELQQAKQQLEILTGQKVNSFAYPFGIYSERDVKIAQQVGYETAVTTIEGVDTQQFDWLQLERIKISGKDSLSTFKLRLKLGQK